MVGGRAASSGPCRERPRHDAAVGLQGDGTGLAAAENPGGDDPAWPKVGSPVAGTMAPWQKPAMARAEGGSARSRITVDLSEATRRRLRTIAARRDLTLQEYVRRAVERQLAEDAPSALRAEDDPVLGELWSNDADAVYDDL
jgi:hypothetical protein